MAYQEPKDLTIREIMKEQGLDAPPAHNEVIMLEDTGDPRDLRAQRGIYRREGWVEAGKGPDGIFMTISKSRAQENIQRHQEESREGLYVTETGLEHDQVDAPKSSTLEPIKANTLREAAQAANDFLGAGTD